jgi:pilus assembly protein TadC
MLRWVGVASGIVLVAVAIVLADTGQPMLALIACALASFFAAHRGGNDPAPPPGSRWRGASSLVVNVVLACGLALEVLFLLAWLLVPATAGQLRGDWVLFTALAIATLQNLFWQRDARFVTADGLHLLAVDAVLSLLSLTLWAGALLVPRIAPLTVIGGELVAADAQHLLLAGVLLQTPVLMLRRGVPSLLNYLENELPLSLERRGFARDAPIYYPVAVTGLTLTMATLAWLWMRSHLPAWAAHPVSGLVFVAFLTTLAFFASVGFIARARTRDSLVAHRYEADERRLLIITSVSLTLVGVFLAAAAWIWATGSLVIGGFRLGTAEIRDLVVYAILAGTGPIGFLVHARTNRLDQLEDRLPDLLSDLAESTRSGLTLSSAVMQARANDYGILSKDVDIMARQLSWGFSFHEAFRRFAERRKSPLVQRISRLVIEAAHSGGNTAEVLSASGRSAYELRALEADRRSAMTTQMIVIYVIYGVFLLVIAVLSNQFIPPLVDATSKTSTTAGFFGGGPSLGQLRGAYVDAILVQAVGSGIVAGVLRESRWTAGLRHVFLMTLIAYVVARFMIL